MCLFLSVLIQSFNLPSFEFEAFELSFREANECYPGPAGIRSSHVNHMAETARTALVDESIVLFVQYD
tara:strand:+ start:2118 stop:2321 length:204 start_codon:yes stop_codon:yes gene_type:complete